MQRRHVRPAVDRPAKLYLAGGEGLVVSGYCERWGEDPHYMARLATGHLGVPG